MACWIGPTTPEEVPMFHRAPFITVVAAIALTAACSATSDRADTTSDGSTSVTRSGETAGSTSSTASSSDATAPASTASTDEEAALFDHGVVHDIDVSYD